MVAIAKPDYTYIWASGGNKVTPPNVKIQTGWIAEPPPYQYENWSQNRQDQAIAHIFQRGVAQWDSLTNYEAGVCYVTGSDGLIYKSVAASGPSAVIKDPITDTTNTYWKVAFATPEEALSQTQADARYLRISNNLSDLSNSVTARTNLSVYSKTEVDNKTTIATTAQAQGWTNNTALLTALRLAESFQGARQSLAASGKQDLPGGLQIRWGRYNGGSGNLLVNYDAFPTAKILEIATPVVANPLGWDCVCTQGLTSLSQSGFTRRSGNGTTTNNAGTFDVFWLVLGY